MRCLLGLLTFAPLALAMGCSNHSASPDWAQRNGGLLRDPICQRRLDRVAASLHAPALHTALRFQVLSSDRLCAYSWPDGSIFVTRGLMDALTDDQLAAAIAHEMGHLIDADHRSSPRALHGAGLDAELAADADAYTILQRSGLSPQLMLDVLSKVRRDSSLDADCLKALGEREQILSARLRVHSRMSAASPTN